MNDRSVMNHIVTYIEDHLNEDLTLDTLAKEFHYSKFYLSRLFSETAGCTIYKYIQGRRLTEAAKKLVETDQAVVDIAYEAHYGSQQAFTLAFHQVYSCAPSTYRKRSVFEPRQPRLQLRCHMAGFHATEGIPHGAQPAGARPHEGHVLRDARKGMSFCTRLDRAGRPEGYALWDDRMGKRGRLAA